MTAEAAITPLPDRWFRTTPDSARLARPRLLARSLGDVAGFHDRIRGYERLTGTAADLRMPIPDFGGLELAAIGSILLIASERPFTPIQRRTAYSLIVPSLSSQLALLPGLGTTILEPPETILPGSRARVRYADGSIAELVEHRPLPGELPRPPDPRAAPPPTGVRLLVRKAVRAQSFDTAVLLYEAVLESACDARIRLEDGPHPVELALIGDLLIVGTDDPEFTRAADVRVALLTESPRDAPTMRPPSGSTGPYPRGVTAGRRLVELPDGLSAEVWDTALGLPAAPAERAHKAGTAPS